VELVFLQDRFTFGLRIGVLVASRPVRRRACLCIHDEAPDAAPNATMLTEPRVSPLYAADLAGLPAATVVTCEHDPFATKRRPTDLSPPTWPQH
jgi:acetyl esterase/lipase